MASSDPPSLPPSCHRDSATQEMIRGREMAGQLGVLLHRGSGEAAGGDDHQRARGLTEEVLRCFSAALAALGSGDSAEFRRAASAPPGQHRWSAEGGAGKERIRPAGERRRGQTKRSQPYAWTQTTSKTLEDGHSWRKYGQKDIQGAQHPRCYFRCTYKHDQGCQATRQVQKSGDDPSLFVITYLGQHTCKKPTALSPQPGVGPATGEQLVIGFGPPELLAPAPFPPPRRESEEDALSCSPSRNDSSPDYLMLPQLTALQEVSAPAVTGISSAASDVAGDVTSGGLFSPCVSPSSGLGVGFTGESYGFEDVFSLDQVELSYDFLRDEPVYGPS